MILTQHTQHSGKKKLLRKVIFSTVIATSLLLAGCKDDETAGKEEAARFAKSATTYQEQGQFRVAMLEAKNAVQKRSKKSSRLYLAC